MSTRSRRSTPARVRAVATVALIALVAAGCGDDAKSLTAAEFSDQGNAVCTEINTKIDGIFSQGDGGDSADGFEALLKAVEDGVGDLRTLAPPKDLAAAVESLLDDADAATADVRAAGPEALFSSEEDPYASLDPAWSAVGLDVCRSDRGGEEGGGEGGGRVEPGPDAIGITAVDYSYQGVPETAEAGVQFALTNDSTGELHELVALRIPDDETRPVTELAKLPEAELDAIFAGRPATVILAPPGETGFAVLGNGSIAEPGRYAIICAIPIGADPQEYLDAPPSDGPPDVAGGPPHFTQGMVTEILVTG